MNTLILLLLILQTHLSICGGTFKPGPETLRNGEIGSGLRRACAGRVGDCTAAVEGEEFDLGSMVSRRMLEMRKRFISYETLRRDMVPCEIPGASYYNCGAAQANHYNRGCAVITRCARSIKN